MKSILLYKLKPYQKKQVLLYNNQSTSDIISTLLNSHKLYASEYDKICDYFWTGSARGTAHKIFNFLKKNVPYRIESDARQTIKSPSAILLDTFGGDCKHYSSWIGGVLSALCRKGKKINWCYRFANYKLFGTVPHHVFCVIKSPYGEIWIDPVLHSFDYKKPYVNKIDKKI
jgi:hypothetical protein